MKKMIAIMALFALPACMGSGSGGGGVTITPDPIDTASNDQMDTLLNNARNVNFDGVEYNAVVGRVAQDHAQDMFDRNYLSTFDRGTTGGPTGGEIDMGDDLVAANRGWDEIVQMVAQGEMDIPTLLVEFRGREITDGIEGDLGFKLDAALEDDEDFEFFGLGKAGTGADQRWAFILVDPASSWSNR